VAGGVEGEGEEKGAAAAEGAKENGGGEEEERLGIWGAFASALRSVGPRKRGTLL
jgi:hypothetical protein